MTAEIAILNRNAVAMAARQMLSTLPLPWRTERFTTPPTSFSRCRKYRPVGVMVYGSGDFMRIPWETIIKMYRGDLGDKQAIHVWRNTLPTSSNSLSGKTEPFSA